MISLPLTQVLPFANCVPRSRRWLPGLRANVRRLYGDSRLGNGIRPTGVWTPLHVELPDAIVAFWAG